MGPAAFAALLAPHRYHARFAHGMACSQNLCAEDVVLWMTLRLVLKHRTSNRDVHTAILSVVVVSGDSEKLQV